MASRLQLLTLALLALACLTHAKPAEKQKEKFADVSNSTTEASAETSTERVTEAPTEATTEAVTEVVTRENTTPRGQVSCEQYGNVYVVTDGCRGFLQVSATGGAFRRNCPAGLLFDVSECVCNFASLVKCAA